jgi:hypothetical protein
MKGIHFLNYYDFEVINHFRTQQTYSTFLFSASRYIDISIYITRHMTPMARPLITKINLRNTGRFIMFSLITNIYNK